MRRRHLRYALACVLAISIAGASTPAGGSTASTVVSASVPSATNVSTLGCQTGTAGSTYLGVVLPGSTVVGSGTCTVAFGSSNDTSMLNMVQSDLGGVAMSSIPHGLDSTFDSDGIVDLDVAPAADDSPKAVLLEPGTDKIMVFGTVTNADEDIYVARLLDDGSLDPTFGGGTGVVQTDLGGYDSIGSVLPDPDGSGYLVAGTTGPGALVTDPAVIRLDANGALDTSYLGTGYKVLPDTSTWEGFGSLQARTTGPGWYAQSFEVTAGQFQCRIIRLTDDFDYDPTFAGDGIYDVAAPYSSDCQDLKELQDGTVQVALAYGVNATRTDAVLARVRPNGTPDTSFAGDGFAELPVGVLNEKDGLQAADVQPNGSLLVAGKFDTSGIPHGFVGRLSSTGAFDPAFGGGDGWQELTLPGHLAFMPASLQPSPTGSGYMLFGISLDAAPTMAARTVFGMLHPDLTWDPTYYDPDGFEVTDLVAQANTLETPQAFIFGRDGEMVVASASQQTDYGTHVARFAASTIDDYQFGVSDWDDGNGAFGACLVGVANAVADWTAGACDGNDAVTWRGVPDALGASSKIAHAASTEQTASASLKFGLRAPTNQPPDVYTSPVLFYVVAPDVP